MRRFCIAILLVLTMLAGCSTSAFDKSMQAGEEAFSLGDYEAAVASFEEALALKPEDVQAELMLSGAKYHDAVVSDPEVKALMLLRDENTELTGKYSGKHVIDYEGSLSLIKLDNEHVLVGALTQFDPDPAYRCATEWYVVDTKENIVEVVSGDYYDVLALKGGVVTGYDDGYIQERPFFDFPSLHIFDANTGEYRHEPYWAIWNSQTFGRGDIVKSGSVHLEKNTIVFEFCPTNDTCFAAEGPTPRVITRRIHNNKAALEFSNTIVSEQTLSDLDNLKNQGMIEDVVVEKYSSKEGIHTEVLITFAKTVQYTCGFDSYTHGVGDLHFKYRFIE